MSNVGCAIAATDPTGAVHLAVIPRAALPFGLAPVAAPEKGPNGRPLVRVVTLQVSLRTGGHDSSRPAVLACLVGASDNAQTVTNAVVRSAPAVRASLRAALNRGTLVPGQPGSLAAVATRALVASQTGESQLATTQGVQAASGLQSSRPLFSYDTYGYGSPFRTPVVYDVTCWSCYGGTVWGMSDIYWLFHFAPDYNWGYVFSREESSCTDVSEKYTTMQVELEELQADRYAMENATNAALNTSTCVPRSDGKNTCIDLFIMSQRAAIVGVGDGRDFDPNAPYKASRVQMYIDFERLTGHAYVNASQVAFGPVTIQADPYPHQAKDFKVTRLAEGVVEVEFHFFNGFCKWVEKDVCPTIDGKVRFQRQWDGSWSPGTPERDPYPSIAIYRQTPGGGWVEQFRDGEGHIGQLIDAQKVIDKWQQDMNDMMRGMRCNQD